MRILMLIMIHCAADESFSWRDFLNWYRREFAKLQGN